MGLQNVVRKPTLGKFIFAVAELIVYLVPRLPARYSHIYELLVHLYHYLLLLYQFVLFSRRNSNHTRRDRRAAPIAPLRDDPRCCNSGARVGIFATRIRSAKLRRWVKPLVAFILSFLCGGGTYFHNVSIVHNRAWLPGCWLFCYLKRARCGFMGGCIYGVGQHRISRK